MNGITQKDVERIAPYFGDFGGMIIPDPMTVEIFDMADDAKQLLSTEGFNDLFSRLTAEIPAPELREAACCGMEVRLIRSRVKYYVVAGHLTLTSLRGVKKASIGSASGDVLVFAAKLSRELGVTLTATLDRGQAADAELRQALKAEGCVLDDVNCVNLHNRPHMYAFQRFIGSRADSAFIPDGVEIGGYPYPALSGIFAEQYGKALRAAAGEGYDAVVATMKNGSAAVAVFRGYRDAGCRFVTVEQPVCQQYYADSFGGATLCMKSSLPMENTYAVSPELCDMWNMAKAVRIGSENHSVAEAEGDMPACTVRALRLLQRKLPELKNVLLVEGENE